MTSIMEIMQLCRFCLVKDQVNIPIFEEQGDIRQIFLKLTACLPVKVSKDDNLPKKICDGCLYKLELLYQFWNTTANAEKQLLTWLNQAGMEANAKAAQEVATVVQQSQAHSVKQEAVEAAESTNENSDDLSTEAQNYILQQQQLPYEPETFNYQQPDFDEAQGDNDAVEDAASEELDEPSPKRRRRQSVKKVIEPEEPDEDDDDISQEMAITKTEEESDTEEETKIESSEPTNFGSMGDSGDNEQPGPSGMGKVNTEAPYFAVDELKVEIHVDEIGEKYFKRYESKWKCNKCVESFTSSRRLRQHKKAAHIKIEDLRQYNYTHNKVDGTYVCNTCDIETDTKNEMENHVQVHEDTYDCNVCNEKFGCAYKYATHVHSHDGDDFKCPICSYKTNRRTSISKHINMLHLHKYIYNCNFCGKGFDDVLIYEEHENSHKGVSEPFSCIVCKKVFPFSRYLLTHQKRNHTVKIDGILLANQCDICKKIFSKPNTLESHKARHEPNSNSVQKHLCDTCGKGFARKDKLVIHTRVHTGEKPYKCSYCSKSFTKKDYLIMHERIHSGEKPYSCEHCGKCFNQGAPLRIHVRSHTGERPYKCFICNNGFISKGALAVHLKACNNT